MVVVVVVMVVVVAAVEREKVVSVEDSSFPYWYKEFAEIEQGDWGELEHGLAEGVANLNFDPPRALMQNLPAQLYTH